MNRKIPKYDEDFKKSIVALFQNGKSQSNLSREYGISLTTIGKWIKIYSEVKLILITFLTSNKSKNFKKEMLSWKRKILS